MPKELLESAGVVRPGSNFREGEARMPLRPCPEGRRTVLLAPGVWSKVFAAIEENVIESLKIQRLGPERPNGVLQRGTERTPIITLKFPMLKKKILLPSWDAIRGSSPGPPLVGNREENGNVVFGVSKHLGSSLR